LFKIRNSSINVLCTNSKLFGGILPVPPGSRPVILVFFHAPLFSLGRKIYIDMSAYCFASGSEKPEEYCSRRKGQVYAYRKIKIKLNRAIFFTFIYAVPKAMDDLIVDI
jgi:hypothetical protein